MLELDQIQIHFDTDGVLLLNIALAVIMFGVALGIRTDDFKNVLKNPKLFVLGITSQFILLPIFTFCFVLLVQPAPSIALGMFLVAACPSGNISNFMTHLAKGNVALSISLSATATLLALVMTPLNFQVYANLYAPTATLLSAIDLNPRELFKIVLLILGVPLVLGMLLRNKKPDFAIKLERVLKPLSIIIFVLFVIIAFSRNLDIFNNYIHHVLALGIAHNLLAIALGFSLASLFKLSNANRKTLAIETGIQNSGLGLVLVFTFFEGLGGMALIVAFWGIWHIISGLLLAAYWSRN